MNDIISICSTQRTGPHFCALTPTDEKAKLFSRVYREAKAKGVLECPYYRPLFIDEVLENIGHQGH